MSQNLSWRRRISPFAALLILVTAHANESKPKVPKGILCFSALTENGWQLFLKETPDGPARQVTVSPGDKLSPRFSEDGQRLYYRDTLGSLKKYDIKTGVAHPAVGGKGVEECAAFSFFPGEKAILIGRLSSKEFRRQLFFKYDTENGREIRRFVPSSGSYADGEVSPDGSVIAVTQLLVYGEQRLGLIDSESDDGITYLTPPGMLAEDPQWSRDGRLIYFSGQQGDEGGLTLRVANLATGTVTALNYPKSRRDSSPSPTGDGRGVFFVRYQEGSACFLDTDRGEVIVVVHGHRCREVSFREYE